MSFIIKHIPEDFCVKEVLAQQCFSLHEPQEFCLYLLDKKGFTTFQAIERIAEYLQIDSELIGYAGLKDEDGITQQNITIPLTIGESAPFQIQEGERFLSLRHVGYCEKPIKVGKLTGNSFKILLRNLDSDIFSFFSSIKKYHLIFPNYYDTQRFGVPGDIKNTHIIGKHLFFHEYERAIMELLKTKTDESRLASESKCDPQVFFHSLDSRKLNFYLNSYMSSIFNEKLISYLASYAESESMTIHGMHYMYPYEKRGLFRMMEEQEWLEVTRCNVQDNVICTRLSLRPSVISTIVNINRWLPDRYHSNKYAVEVCFFLPSGTYATLAMRQMELLWKKELSTER